MFDFNPRRGSIAARAMKIRKLKLTNFRGLRDEDIDFDESITVFAEKNGGGKSTVLEAVAIMLSWLPARISNYAAAGRQIRTADITVGCDFSKLEMTLARENAHPGEEMKLTLFKRANKSGPDGKSDMSAARKFGDNTRVLLDSNGYNVEIPVFAYYGADRNTLGIPAPLPAAARTSIYANAFDAGVNFAKFSGWLASAIEKRRYEMEKLAGEPLKKANRLRGEINEHFAALAHIQKALRDFSEEFDGLYVENGRLWIKAKNIPADYLSEGEKTVAALLGDIALRMVVANPGMKNPLAAAAIVLIDELDLHLHPDWQTMLAEKLPRIFPNSQFIISSHSPSVISVDFGTATTFDCVSGNTYLGGLICPGLFSARTALAANTAKLPRISLEMTESEVRIGSNTITSMNHGFLFGFAAMTEGLCERLKAQLPGPVFVVGTGGAARDLSRICRAFDTVRPDLILEGLRLLWIRNGRWNYIFRYRFIFWATRSQCSCDRHQQQSQNNNTFVHIFSI